MSPDATPRVRSGPVRGACSALMTCAPVLVGGAASERLEVLDEVAPLLLGEAQVERLLVARDHVAERRRAPIVEVWRMLEEAAERRRAVRELTRAGSVARIHPRLGGRVEHSPVHVRE